MQSTATSVLGTRSFETAAPVQKKAGFLRPFDEMVMLAIPTIGLFVTMLAYFFSRAGFGTISVNDVSTLLVTLIFMDGVHVTFTFTLIAFLPELRQWSVSDRNRPSVGWDKGWSFWKRMFVIASALAVIIFVLKLSPYSNTVRGLASIWLFLELLGPSQHTAAQMRGISFVYNSTIRKAYAFNDAEKLKAASAEHWERLLFKAIIAGDVLYWLPKLFQAEHFVIPGIRYVQILGGVLVAGGAIGLLFNSFRYPKQEETDKTLFLTRVLLFPFKIINPIGGLAIRATHGTEYLLIFRRIVQSSKISEKKKKLTYYSTAAVSVLYGLLFVALWGGPLNKMFGIVPGRDLIGIAVAVTFVVRFTHYYMDALIFKMSDPVTREAVSPLLVPAKR